MNNFWQENISRRTFLKRAGLFLLGVAMGGFLFRALFLPQTFSKKVRKKVKKDGLRKAMAYKKLDKDTLRCEVCFRQCLLKPGQRGFCRNRENQQGVLYNLVYGNPSAIHIDPIEKEPAYHMLPGSFILCFGTAGCNFRCKNCQNWTLSQSSIEEMAYVYPLTPKEAVNLALRKKIPTLSFTYNDPIAFCEYVYDIARLAQRKGLKILWHSNGSFSPKALKALLSYTDAVTIDLKGFTQKFYEQVSSARLEPVLEAMKIIYQQKKWLEIVNLIIPTFNDQEENIRRMCEWIRDNLSTSVPLHFSRFFPSYRMKTIPPTPIKTLEKAYTIAKEVGLEYVTIGNVPGHKYNSTFCPQCNKLLIHRIHFTVLRNELVKSRCKFCGYHIPGIWE